MTVLIETDETGFGFNTTFQMSDCEFWRWLVWQWTPDEMGPGLLKISVDLVMNSAGVQKWLSDMVEKQKQKLK